MEHPDLSSGDTALAEIAEACMEKGKALESQGKPEVAEVPCRKALQITDLLWNHTGQKNYALTAREICLSLADLSMQQGNMHGADYYYAQALFYGQCSDL